MNISRKCGLLLALSLIGVLPILAHAVSATTPPPEVEQSRDEDFTPHPALSPEDVVRAQLRALAQNDVPYANAGIEYAFRFASPSNKRHTGPLERFIQLLHTPAYVPMLNHGNARYGETQIEEDQAWQSVILTFEGGEQAGYVFLLRRQDTESCQKCWMTESVVRLPLKPNGDETGDESQ